MKYLPKYQETPANHLIRAMKSTSKYRESSIVNRQSSRKGPLSQARFVVPQSSNAPLDINTVDHGGEQDTPPGCHHNSHDH